jgi:hypothetical protein
MLYLLETSRRVRPALVADGGAATMGGLDKFLEAPSGGSVEPPDGARAMRRWASIELVLQIGRPGSHVGLRHAEALLDPPSWW